MQGKKAAEKQPKPQPRKEREQEQIALAKHTKLRRVEYFKGYRL